MPIKTRRDALKGVAALTPLLLSSCADRDGEDDANAGGRAFQRDDLTPLERKFGIGPGKPGATRGKNFVKVRPDVHVVQQGPAAVRDVAANGLSWTLDPKITGPIEVGRVLLVTNRCAGRVLATRPVGDQVEVFFGPTELTEYIEKADVSSEQPVDFSQAIRYSAPDYPGAESKVGGGASPPPPAAWNDYAPRASHAVLTRDDRLRDLRGDLLRVQNEDVAEDARFTVEPFLDLTSLGVQIRSYNDVIKMLGDVRLRFSAPTLSFDLKIDDSKLVTTSVRLSGSAALMVTFKAHSNHGVHGNVRTRYFIPVDCMFPISALRELPVPFAATMRHMFMLQTAFSSKGNVDAVGQYGMDGAIEMSFGGGGIRFGAPSSFAVQRSLAKSTSGVTMGPAGLILTHQVRAIVGIGAFGFVTGPYVGVTSTAAVTKGSSADTMREQCREATLRMSIHAGVGYQIPKSIAGAINSVLSLFHVKGIAAEGGFQTPDKELVNKTDHYPNVNSCRAGGVVS